MKKTTLVILAAGLGSRFGGGIKQLTRFGRGGKLIIDFSIHDAIEAGFNKVVFLIRRDIEEEFRALIGDRISEKLEVEYAYQSLEDLPDGLRCPETRKKPWGTGQALLCCKDAVKEPFAVINADDYYGKEAFRAVHDYLVGMTAAEEKRNACMAGFVLRNTLSEHGGVTRGICSVSADGYLQSVTETYQIHIDGDRIRAQEQEIDPQSTVSMNFWGFTPDIFPALEKGFRAFLKEHLNDEKKEYLLPAFVDGLVASGSANVRVLPSHDSWFGVTYREDVGAVSASIQALIDNGTYPEDF